MTSQRTRDGTVAQRFRGVMAQVPAAVAVVTTRAGGEPYGTTVSAFTSLSMDPPMFLVSLDNASSLLSRLHVGAVAGVNVLTDDHADIAAHYARKNKDDLPAEYELIDEEPPRLPGAHARITFTVTELVTIADHTLVIGTVTTAHATPTAPLIYWQRTYGTHTAAGSTAGNGHAGTA